MQSEIAELFLDYSVRKLEDMTQSIELCLAKLSDQQVWERNAEHDNAIANLMLHLCGNIRQWIMHGVADKADTRTRDAEFSRPGGLNKRDLLHLFRSTITEAQTIIAALPHGRLVARTDPQKLGTVSVLEAIYQVVGHVQQHTGQIILLTKQMIRQDLDLTIPRLR